MDTNRILDRSAMHTTPSKTSSVQSFSSLSMPGCGSSLSDTGCSNGVHTTAGFSCNSKGAYPKNTSSKILHNPRGTNGSNGSQYGSVGSNTSGYCSSNSSISGNYFQVLPVSIGSLTQQQQQQQHQQQQHQQQQQQQHYNRRKATSEYQSRLYNSTDYRCRDDFYSLGSGTGGSARLSTASPSPSLPLQSLHHQYQHTQQNSELQRNSQQQQQQTHHQQQQYTQQYNHHSHYQQHQLQQQQQQQHQQTQSLQHHHHHHHHHHQQQQQQQSNTLNLDNNETYLAAHSHICTPTNTYVEDDNSLCSQINSNQNKRVVASTQTPITEGCNSETLLSPNVTLAPAMYSLHRVVATAQLQAGTSNTFASSSSISSLVNSTRNDTDCLQVSGAMGKNNLKNNFTAAEVMAAGYTECSNNMSNKIEELSGPTTSAIVDMRNLNGSNSNCHAQQQAHATSRSVNNYSNVIPTASNTNTINGAKTYSQQSRPLENVIPTCVYLMSRIAVHMEIEGTAQCPSQVMLAATLGCEELGIANKLLAQSIFALWMTSPLLEIQLKVHHCPYAVRLAWSKLLAKFSSGTTIEKSFDDPMITLRRNVFFSKRDEEKIKDQRILELLYEEAKHNVLSGRYVMEAVHALMLGGIQSRIELGPFNSHTHTISFFRENQTRFLPHHVAKSSSWSWLPVSRRNSAEAKLLDQFKRVPQTTTTRKLMRKYLEFCWALPFYGAAFFHGQVEQPVRGLMSLFNQKDLEVEVAVNERGIFVIDRYENTLLLGLRYEDFSWDFAKPSSNEPDCFSCIFIQFNAVENGIQITKLIQIFSKQAAMIDALVSHFAEQMRKRRLDASNGSEQVYDEPNPIQNNGQGVLSNKLSRLTLATFDEEGRCIGQMGTLSISF